MEAEVVNVKTEFIIKEENCNDDYILTPSEVADQTDPPSGAIVSHNDVNPSAKLADHDNCSIADPITSNCISLQDNQREILWLCIFCNKVFKNDFDKQKHDCLNSKALQCTICHQLFTKSSSLKTHQTLHTGERPFNCEFCEQTFRCSSNLKRHRLLHTGEKPFECNSCNKTFRSSTTLNRHTLVHTGEKPFKCKFCDKMFRVRATLTTHEHWHTGEKHYRCKYCTKSFTDRSGLKFHERLHTGEKPFECKFCHKKFTHSSNMNSHQRRCPDHKQEVSI